MTRSEVSKIRVRSQAEVVLLHQLAERATLLACLVRRMGYVPRVTRQETLDVTTLELFDRLPPGSLKALAGYEIAFGGRPFVRQGDVLGCDSLPFRTHGCPLHGIKKLADVSRPGMVFDLAYGR